MRGAYSRNLAMQRLYSGASTGVGASVPSAASATYIVSENFDGSNSCALVDTTTNCNMPADSWVYEGTPDFDNTEKSLEGTYGAKVVGPGDIKVAFSALGELWFYCIIQIDTIDAPDWDFNTIFNLYNSGTDVQALYGIRNNGTAGPYVWAISSLAEDADGTANPSADTTYHIWGYYKKGTGNDAIITLWVSTNATKPETPTVTKTNGNGTTDIVEWEVEATTYTDNIWVDKIRIDDVEIGSNPS